MTCNTKLPIIDFCDIKKGASYSQILTFLTEDVSTGTETKRDFAEVTAAQLVIKEKLSSTSALLTLSLGSGLTIDAEAATLKIEITAAQTSSISVQSGVYDCFFTYSDGTVESMFEGKIIFRSGTI